ncbi:MAG: hypothetical protein [Bacteriophage sp.]|nr:MAG: hypothetical protein [Bacteriophage sp.]
MLKKFNDVAKDLCLSRNGLKNHIKTDPTFPRPIRFGDNEKCHLYFKAAEIEAWLDNIKPISDK